MTRRLSKGDDWKFLAEGNANVIYMYVGQDECLKEMVLRLRKQDQSIDSQGVYRFIEEVIRPILDVVIPLELAEVCFVKEGTLSDGYGLLMPNLLVNTEVIRREKYFTVYRRQEVSVVEIKPKWLARSSLGCRNCAHYRCKHSQEPTFCSGHLVDTEKLHSAVKMVTEHSDTQNALLKYLEDEDNVFKRLKSLQTDKFSFEGISREEEVQEEHCLQMTLRDVTVFLAIKGKHVIETTIIDADPKSAKKWLHWIQTEKELHFLFYQNSALHR